MCRLLRHDLGQCGGEFICFEAKRPRFTLVCHSAILVEQVNAVGPTGVSLLCRIAKLIEDSRKFDSQFPYASPGNQRALLFILRTGEDYLVLDVALHLPDVAGMRLSDVHDQERNFVLVLIVKLVEGGNLPPEGRSGVAAKDHDYRLLLVKFRQANPLSLVELH